MTVMTFSNSFEGPENEKQQDLQKQVILTLKNTLSTNQIIHQIFLQITRYRYNINPVLLGPASVLHSLAKDTILLTILTSVP